MKKFLSVTISVLLSAAVIAQADNRDSSRARGMRNMKAMLKLSDAQVKSITDLTIAEEKKVAQMRGAPMNPEARKQQMENNYDTYRKAIKKILTKEQWDQYVVLQNERRNQLVEEGKKKKIKVQLGKIKD